jgi:hypothetical protein
MKLQLSLLIAASLATTILVANANTDAQSPKPKFNSIEHYDKKIKKSKEGLLSYKAETKKKIDKLTSEVASEEEIFVTITFTKPVNKAQVTKLVNDYNLKIGYSIARLKGENGLRSTMFTKASPENGFINEETTNLSSSQNKSEFKGFIELIGTVPSKKLQALASENFVFLVDPSADSHLVLNPKMDYVPGAFWKLEDNNMVTE